MLTRTFTILSTALVLGAASSALAMSPTGNNYKAFANSYAKVEADTVIAQPRYHAQAAIDLADRQSFFYRR